MLVEEITNSWNPVVDGGRGGATPQQRGRHINVECQEFNVTSRDSFVSFLRLTRRAQKFKRTTYCIKSNLSCIYVFCIATMNGVV